MTREMGPKDINTQDEIEFLPPCLPRRMDSNDGAGEHGHGSEEGTNCHNFYFRFVCSKRGRLVSSPGMPLPNNFIATLN